MREIHVRSSLDKSEEPSLLYLPNTEHPAPLVVGLHSWSYDRQNQVNGMLPFAREHGWALLLPEFRGPNMPDNPRAAEACGSRLARQDIVDAVQFVFREYSAEVDPQSVFLLGGSGGGHMALLMAAYAPRLWRAVSAWCPITDLRSWHAASSKYAPRIEACCGGPPENNGGEYCLRSPMAYVDGAAAANLFIHHGKFDTSVSYEHSLDFYNALVSQFPDARVFLDIFDGAHEIRYTEAFATFAEMLEPKEERKLTG